MSLLISASCVWVEVTLSTRDCVFLKTIAVKCKSWLADLASYPSINDNGEFITTEVAVACLQRGPQIKAEFFAPAHT